MTKILVTIGATAALAFIGVVIVLAIASIKPTGTASSTKLQVVAAENFWGSLASQIGGDKVSVTSIVSDPNADPHEYESSTKSARAVASASYVIINGAGYDSWADKLLNSGDKNGRIELNVAQMLGKKQGANPHFWYDPDYVLQVSERISQDLERLSPSNAGYFKGQYANLLKALGTYQSHVQTIKDGFAGTKVASTESIFVYLAQATSLDLVSPTPFMQAISEGNDPPIASVIEFQQQLKNGNIKLLIYNSQTVTPLTDSIKQMAISYGIPVVGITETMQPPDTTFEAWMDNQLTNIEKALRH